MDGKMYSKLTGFKLTTHFSMLAEVAIMRIIIVVICLAIFTISAKLALASSIVSRAQFISEYPCSNGIKSCVSSGVRMIDGFSVHEDCWDYSYLKTCNYPSKNDCSNYGHCYAINIVDCLLRDSLGNCVNQREEFSCKRWIPSEVEDQKVRMGFTEKTGGEGIVCKGIPCIDGNCVDKSYETNGEMMDSISKLYMVSQIKDAKDMNMRIFTGYASHCSKKATSYTNCCSTGLGGWGTNIGAHCSANEKELIESRRKNLCIYVGKENKGVMKTVVKHHYCCFGNLLQKVIQIEGRKQLHAKGLMSITDRNFGSGGNTNCRGLTLAELQNLDFDKMDLTEFIEDFKAKFVGRYRAPNIGDMEARIRGTSSTNIRHGDDNPQNKENNKSGWSNTLRDDSFEAEEERNFNRGIRDTDVRGNR